MIRVNPSFLLSVRVTSPQVAIFLQGTKAEPRIIKMISNEQFGESSESDNVICFTDWLERNNMDCLHHRVGLIGVTII